MMSTLPLVSIITPSFNQAAFLEATLRSVLQQDYPNLEYLVVDGASEDGSLEIIHKYSSKLAWWVSEKDCGQAEAINKGLRRARGEIIAWLNSDDLYARGAILKAVRAFKEAGDCGVVFSNVFSINAQGELFNVMRYADWGLKDLMAFNIIGQPGVFMRRALLEKVGYLEPNYHYLLDHQLWLRMAAAAPIRYVDNYFAAARFHPTAKNVAQASEFSQEAFSILEWMQARPSMREPFLRNRRRIMSGAYRLSARYLLDGGFPGRAFQHYLASLWHHPRTASKELRRMLFALFSLFFPSSKMREDFIQRRARSLPVEIHQQFEDLFDDKQS